MRERRCADGGMRMSFEIDRPASTFVIVSLLAR
jgi:hypothetical protein